MFGNNIKIHFAGAEGGYSPQIALDGAGVNYRLYSCYRYILNKDLDSDFAISKKDLLLSQDVNCKHVIQDSGLFTLMFGAEKGKKQTRESLTLWQDKLIAFVTRNNIQATCVELDCQKVLGVDEAWYFRERMKAKLPNRQINVFHFEDGREGLDRLIEFSDYIAISVPELRIVKPKSYKQDTHKLAYYIKSKKPEIDIHLLGCTEVGMLKENAFCTSADSTSWMMGVQYGSIGYGSKRGHVSNFKAELRKPREKKIIEIADKAQVEMTPKAIEYVTNLSLCATLCLQEYEKAAGDQS